MLEPLQKCRGFLVKFIIMANQLTYILGAGASFESIPIVKTFPKRFQLFNEYLEKVAHDTRFGEDMCNYYGKAGIICKNISEEFSAHQSFDTYFKKLYHTAQTQRIRLSKKILNLYFLWEHLSTPVDSPPDFETNDFYKKSIIDKRYDALIAGLLQPIAGKADPFTKVNFITWNYDLNLFFSLKNYFEPKEDIDCFLKSIKNASSESIWEIGDKITVLNLNGFFYSEILAKENSINNLDKDIHQFITSKLNEKYFDDDFNDSDSELIKFAWESFSPIDKRTPNVVIEATRKIQMSSDIIIVGYTFPLYNRLVDFSYLKQRDIFKTRVAIQDPSAEAVKNNFCDIYKISIQPAERIKTISNCDSFYIPTDIFNSSDINPYNGYDLSFI